MKKMYILLHNSIVGMGGGQMYVRNKIKYMEQQGWRCISYSGTNGDIMIDEMKKYKEYIISELVSSPLIYSKKVVDKVLEKLSENTKEMQEIVIESGSPHMACWGELLAIKLNCKNMVHLLDERNDLVVPINNLNFFRFKLKRRELSGITQKSLKILFRNSSEITDENNSWLPSVCQNVVEDIRNNIIIPIANKTLGCIGRLDKDYIRVVVNAFVEISKHHKNEKFNVVFIGGAGDESKRREIENVFKDCHNVNLIITGYVYPIPKSFFKDVDVFVSSSGSASVSYGEECPTISIDANDLMAIGVVGYTTQKTLYREDEEKQDVFELLEKVLYSDYLKKFKYTPKKVKPNISQLSTHVDFLNNSVHDKEYYDVMTLALSGKEVIKKFFCVFLGCKGYLKFRSMYSKVAKLKRK